MNGKEKNKKIIALLGIFIVSLMFSSCSDDSKLILKKINSVVDNNIYSQTCTKLFPELPITTDKNVYILTDSLEELKFEIKDINLDEQKKYLDKCKNLGYTIDAVSKEKSYKGFAKSGFKLITNSEENNLTVLLTAPMKMSEIKFKKDGLYRKIPLVDTTKGNLIKDKETVLEFYLGDISKEKYLSYVDKCKNLGFNKKVKNTDTSYKAEDEEEYRITVNYEGFNQIYIKVESPIYKITLDCNCNENWLFSIYDLKIYIDDKYVGKLKHGDKEKYKVNLPRGTYTIKVVNAEDSDIHKTMEYDAIMDETIKLEFSCYNSSISVWMNDIRIEDEELEDDDYYEDEELEIDGIRAPYSSYTSTNYKDVINGFKDAGFKKVVKKPIYDVETGWLASLDLGDTESIIIGGNSDFDRDDVFDENDKVVVKYHTWEWKNPKIKWMKRSVSKLVKEIDSNAMIAKKKYEDKFVKVTGRIKNIDNNGNSFDLYPTDNKWSIYDVYCSVDLENVKNKLINYSSGDIVTVRGKITSVGEILGYNMDVYGISRKR